MSQITTLFRASLVALLAGVAAPAQAPRQAPAAGVLDGYVRDQDGKPVKGVRITVNQGSYAIQGHTDVIPLFIPNKLMGAIVFNDPNAVEQHSINEHAATTDAKGHYSFKKLPPGTYTFWASPTKKSFNDWGAIVEVKKLARSYRFPEASHVTIAREGPTAQDVTLLPRAPDGVQQTHRN
jgi:protocatechuate 3,4-dioxygenase beta subunit